MWPNQLFSAYLVRFTEEIINGKLSSLRTVNLKKSTVTDLFSIHIKYSNLETYSDIQPLQLFR